jgi:hypothetical protein
MWEDNMKAYLKKQSDTFWTDFLWVREVPSVSSCEQANALQGSGAHSE